MADILKTIIENFSKEEYREFKYFLGIHGGDDISQYEKLTSMYRNKKAADEKVMKAFNNNAFYLTRRRLKKQMELFMLLENSKSNPDSYINSLIECSKYLFRKNLFKEAWHYSIEAEELAIERGEHDLLNNIYYLQIANFHNESPLDLHALLDKREKNLAVAKLEGNAYCAFSLLMNELNAALAKSTSVKIDDIADKIISDYSLGSDSYNNLHIFSSMTSIICKALYEKKDYEYLKTYAIAKYKEMRDSHFFEAADPEFKLELLRYIYFSSLRTFDYGICAQYLELYKDSYQEYKHLKNKYTYHDLMYGMLLADLYLCTAKIEEAAEELLKLKAHYENDVKHERLVILLNVNLATIYFNKGNYLLSTKFLKLAKDKEKKMIKEHTVEMALYTDISAVLAQVELKEKDYSIYLIDTLFRRFKGVLNEPSQKRIKLFLSILQKIIISPATLKKAAFKTEIEEFLKLKEFIPGDKEFISLNAWLKSKMNDTRYYDEFIKLIQKAGEEDFKRVS